MRRPKKILAVERDPRSVHLEILIGLKEATGHSNCVEGNYVLGYHKLIIQGCILFTDQRSHGVHVLPVPLRGWSCNEACV